MLLCRHVAETDIGALAGLVCFFRVPIFLFKCHISRVGYIMAAVSVETSAARLSSLDRFRFCPANQDFGHLSDFSAFPNCVRGDVGFDTHGIEICADPSIARRQIT